MNKPRFVESLWHMALLMLLAFVLVLVLLRDSWAMPLIFSAMPLASVLERVIYLPLMGFIPSIHRLEAAMWLMVVAAYLQWTLLGALLAYLWGLLRYRRAPPPLKKGQLNPSQLKDKSAST
jgi:hypothetical protein